MPSKYRIGLRCESTCGPTKVKVAGYVEQEKDGRAISSGTPSDYDVEIWNCYKPTCSVDRPSAYLVPAELKRVLEALRLHGVKSEALSEDQELSVEVYRIDKAEIAEKPFQNHRVATVEVTPRTETRRFAAGTLLVRTNQKLGALAIYLLEPQSEDGLVTWNFFDDQLKTGGDFPVVRLTSPAQLKTHPIWSQVDHGVSVP